jgi:hypothetical protein
MRPSRRRLLLAAGSLVGLGVVTFGGSFAICTRRAARTASMHDASRRLFAALPDIRDADAVGAAVLAGQTDLAPASLLPALAADPALTEACRLDCPATRRTALAAVFREELQAGRFVLAERWVLAPSEARIAALWLASGRPDPLA